MKLITITVMLFFLFISAAAATEMIEFDFLINEEGDVSLINTRTFLGNVEKAETKDSDYQFMTYDGEGEILQQVNLPVYFFSFDPFVNVKEVPISIKIPYQENYKIVRINHQEELLYTKDISFLCQKDGICQANENFVSCPTDCPSGSQDGLCVREVDNRCDPDCLAGDPDCQKSEKSLIRTINNIFLIMGILAFILLVIVGILFWQSKFNIKK
tara:strand:- start:230 stop:871 length:642 start_codon:yes stop_codon:yes gene_type:complete